MNTAMKGICNIAKSNIDNLSTDLKRLSEIEDIIEKLKFPQDSKAKKLADEFIENCDKLRIFLTTLPKDYPNAGMHTN